MNEKARRNIEEWEATPGVCAMRIATEVRDEEISRLRDVNRELVDACRILSEGWFQREHPDSPGITITDEQMAEAAYDARAILAKAKEG
jgi:hypothetical protein